MIPTDLPPWDALAYYFAPKETFYTSCVAGSLAIGPNPQREYLIFSVGDATVVWVSTASNPTGKQGIQLTASTPFVTLSRLEHGPLVQAAWYFSNTVLATFTVIEINLRVWPDKAGAGMLDQVDPGPKPPPVRIDTGPGVNGKRGILDYWLSLIPGILGGKRQG